MRRPVGILGGMGPEATVLLMQKVIHAIDARDDADHIPLLVDQNPQVPSRIARLIEGDGADPLPILIDMAERLQTAGAQALAMPCNTAHVYAPQIAAAVDIPFLNMVSLTVENAALTAQTGRVGILCSPAVRKVGLFDQELADAGLEAAYPDDEAAMLAAIRQIKAEGPVALAKSTLAAASGDLLAEGAEVQLIACTEFSLIASSLATGAKPIDTMDELTAAIVAFSTGHPEADQKADARRSCAAVPQNQNDQQGKEISPC